jgi:flagellar protein FliS
MITAGSQLAYQEAAVRNANAVELVVMLYDILAKDLQRAIASMEAGDIEARTRHVKHGLLVLQQLEGTLDMEQGGQLASSMSRFYHMMRSQMMKAQIEQDASILGELVQLLLSVREAWVQINTRNAGAAGETFIRAGKSAYDLAETQSASWSG